jgi:Domain of unknown function (DUF4157)
VTAKASGPTPARSAAPEPVATLASPVPRAVTPHPRTHAWSAALGNQAALRTQGALAAAGLPTAARAGIETPSEPLDASLGRTLGAKLGADFSGVRIHDNAGAAHAARTLAARAYTFGEHIAFARGAFDPSSARGLGLITHELAHVAQQARGDSASLAAQEAAADRLAVGGSPGLVSGGPPRPMLRLSPGDILGVTITLLGDERANFLLEIEGSDPVRGTGRASGLPVGEYRLRRGEGGIRDMDVTTVDGAPLSPDQNFHATVPDTLAGALRRLGRTPIPLIVRESSTDEAPAVPGVSGSGTGDPLRDAIAALPQRIRDFLFTATGAVTQREDLPALLRIAAAISDLTDSELAEYRARTTGETRNIDVFERGVTAWLSEVRARRAATTEEQAATMALFGQRSLWDQLMTWYLWANPSGDVLGLSPSGVNQQLLTQYEATAFPVLHVVPDAFAWAHYYNFRRALHENGYANVAAFETAIRRFIVAFRERAFYIALESLGRYEHLLIAERARYTLEVAGALHTRLAPARRELRAADELHEQYEALRPSDEVEIPSPRRAEIYAEYQQTRASGVARAGADVAAEPLAAHAGFDAVALAREADAAGVQRRVHAFIDDRLEKVRATRTRLRDDHELVFAFDTLVQTTKRRADIDEDTIWSHAIAGHRAPSIASALLGVLAGVIGIALTIATMGTGLPAVLVAMGMFGMSAYFAIDSYLDYAVQSDAYAADLLSTRPWFGWVVIAVIGAGLDLAAVGAAVRAARGTLELLRPAAAALEETGNVAAFNEAVQRLVADPATRTRLLEAAAARAEANAAWREVANAPTVAPRGAMRASMFGLDIAIDALLATPRVMYAMWLELRSGVRTFQRWIRTPAAIELFGDVSQFSPQRLRDVQRIFTEAERALQQVANRARELGMSTTELDSFLQWYAMTQRGSTDDMLRILAQSRAISIEPGVLARITADGVDAARVRLVAATIEDTALRAQLLSEERVWRTLHNAGYDPAVLNRAWRDFRAEGSSRSSMTFADYLYQSNRYTTTLGRTPRRPLTTVIANWGSLVGAQRTRAVFAQAEPVLAAALAGTEPIAGVNPETIRLLRELLQADLVGERVTMYEVARGQVMAQVNDIIGRTTTTERELRAILALTESSGSTGSIGERFVALRLSDPLRAASDIAQPSFTRAEMGVLLGDADNFRPDRIIRDAHISLDVKTGYARGIDVRTQAANYAQLGTVSATNPSVAARLGGPLRGHAWLVLPAGDLTRSSAQGVARSIWTQLDAGLRSSQRVFFLDEAGAIMQVTGATTQVRAGATIHEALGLAAAVAP